MYVTYTFTRMFWGNFFVEDICVKTDKRGELVRVSASSLTASFFNWMAMFRFYSNVYSQPHTQKHPSKFGWIETKREKNIFFRIIFANLLMTSWDLEKHIVFRVRSNLNCEEQKRNRRSNDTQQKMLKLKKKTRQKETAHRRRFEVYLNFIICAI